VRRTVEDVERTWLISNNSQESQAKVQKEARTFQITTSGPDTQKLAASNSQPLEESKNAKISIAGGAKNESNMNKSAGSATSQIEEHMRAIQAEK